MSHPESRSLRRLVFAALLAAAAAAIWRTLPPNPRPANAPATEFSAERAAGHVRALAKQPRPAGSAANALARDYVLAELSKLGLETRTQRVGELENVVGRIVGARSPNAVLLTAHLDSVAASPGAADDGSGVAVLLETARALASGGPLPNTVMLLFSDFEEGGSVGAKAFITGHPWARDVRVVIGLDAGGLSGPGVLSATSARNGWLIRQWIQADPHLIGSSAINALAESRTDFGLSFVPAGFSGYAFDLYWDKRTHTPEDNVENLNLSSLQHQGDHALSLARRLSFLDPLTDPKEFDAVYFNVLRLFTVTYPSTYAIPLAAVTAGIFCGVLTLGLKWQILSWRGIGYGTFVFVAGLLLAPLPGLLFGGRAPGERLGFVGRSLEPFQASVAVLSSLILTIAWYALSQRLIRTKIQDLALGALVAMVAGMAGTAIILPALSFAFPWPLFLSLLACAHWFYTNARQENSKMVVPILLLAGMTNTVILVPTILLGLFDQMPLTLGLLGILCGYLVPLIHLLLGSGIGIPERAGG